MNADKRRLDTSEPVPPPAYLHGRAIGLQLPIEDPQHRPQALELDALTERILACVFEVSNVLGAGFLEKVYQRALLVELRLNGLAARSEVPCRVAYKGRCVGDYIADVVVEDRVVIQLKCVDSLGRHHMAQCINYLKASGLTVALLVNFQRSKVEWMRVVNTR